MQTTFDHTFRADLMKSNIFLYEQDATGCSKMLQRSNFLGRTTSKALPDTGTIITRSIVKHSKIAVTKENRFDSKENRFDCITFCPEVTFCHVVSWKGQDARHLLKSPHGYAPASESPADG